MLRFSLDECEAILLRLDLKKLSLSRSLLLGDTNRWTGAVVLLDCQTSALTCYTEMEKSHFVCNKQEQTRTYTCGRSMWVLLSEQVTQPMLHKYTRLCTAVAYHTFQRETMSLYSYAREHRIT